MIKLTIQDSTDSMTFGASLITPIQLSPIINETDVETIDGNISTYYGSTKRQYKISLLPMDTESYASLRAFVMRQYQALKYPRITVEGDQNLNINNMTAKMTLSDIDVVNSCGLVNNIKLTFRESKQMP